MFILNILPPIKNNGRISLFSQIIGFVCCWVRCNQAENVANMLPRVRHVKKKILELFIKNEPFLVSIFCDVDWNSKSISKGYVFLVLYLMEFVKFQIKMAMIKSCDLQRFYIFTWHLREFWAHTFFPERFFSWRAIFFVAVRASRVFVSWHSSLSHRHPVQVLASRRLVLTRHEPGPVLNLARPDPRLVLILCGKASRQNLAALARGGIARVDETQPESRGRGDDHDLQRLGGLAYMQSLDL